MMRVPQLIHDWKAATLGVAALLGFLGFSAQALAQSGVFVNGNPQYYAAQVQNLKSPPVTVYPKVEGNYSLVTWNTLSHFKSDTPDIDEEIDPNIRKRKKKLAIPKFISDLNNASVAVVGFMIPMDIDNKGEKTTGFILARSQATCCYGIMPKLNEWIYVTMDKGTAADIVMDIPVTTFGTLEVGEKNIPDEGWSLYRMTGQKIGAPKESKW